jgi:hypothetical protein
VGFMAIQWSEATVTVENVLDDDPNVHLYNAREYLRKNDYRYAIWSMENAWMVSKKEQIDKIKDQCYQIAYKAWQMGYDNTVFFDNMDYYLYNAEKSLEDGYYNNAVEKIKYVWKHEQDWEWNPYSLQKKQDECIAILEKLQRLGYGTEITWIKEARRGKRKVAFTKIILRLMMLLLINLLFDGIIVWVLGLCVMLPAFVGKKSESLAEFLKPKKIIKECVGIFETVALIGLVAYFVFSHLLGWNVITNIICLILGAVYVYDYG